MNNFILILIVLITNCEPGESSTSANPQIILTKLSSNEQPQDVRTQYTVLANKPMCYNFQNMSVSRGWCFDYYNHSKVLDEAELLAITNPCVIVTHAMSTLWKCNVTDDNENKRTNPKRTKYLAFYFNLHVKGAQSVEVTVNGKELMFSEADLSVPYDGDTVYFYEDGEHVQIVCRNPQSTGTVHLEYLTKEVANGSNSTTFGIQLHSGSNNSHIDCVYINTTKPIRYVYRVTFVTSERFINLNEMKTGNQDKAGGYSTLILGSSIGAVLVVLGMAGVACWYARTKIKLVEAPYMTYHSESPSQSSQNAIEWENQHNACYNIPENLENQHNACYNIPENVENQHNACYDIPENVENKYNAWYDVPENVENKYNACYDIPENVENKYNACYDIPENVENKYNACYDIPENVENKYNACYDIPENVENIDPKDHYYAEIDYLTCKPKIEETQLRVSRVYDEPYV